VIKSLSGTVRQGEYGVARSPQLDALRGIAVSLVLLHHWTKLGQNIGIGLGNIGVQLFFVLSGFLITRILLDLKKKCLEGNLDYRTALVTFHLDRMARIWPIFYGTLIFVFLQGDRFEKSHDMLWHALFATNILSFERGHFDGSISHFWTLAVEQQFYLVWPLLVLFVPLRYMEIMILFLIAAAPITRVALYGAGFTNFAQYNTLPIANFDSLGFGAIIALWSRAPTDMLSRRWRLLSVLSAMSVVAIGGLRGLSPISENFRQIPTVILGNGNIEQTVYAIIFAWIVLKASTGFSGPIGRLLEMRPLVSLGIVSYGVYVYHPLATRLVAAALKSLGVPVALQSGGAPADIGALALLACFTFGVASVSWSLVEKPVLAWRRRAHTRSLANAPQPASAS
jgi:peptidoglycan/LPS O-acetylase OafA/YrhL